MESNIIDQQAFSADLELAEPHFDEESTLLSARPVVPLRAIEAQARSSRTLVFGLAIAVALMAGALVATIIYKQRGQNPAPTLVEAAVPVSEPTSPQTSTSSEAAAVTPAPVEAKTAIPENEADITTPKTRASESAKKPAPLISKSSASARNSTAADEARKARKELRRAERADAQLERDARHQARRETRARRANGVTRIREIFEGSSRP
jgi:cytoskeletal protein RodZ